MKKDQNLLNETFTVIIVLENFQTVRVIPDTNHLIILIKEADHQNKEIHKISQKIDIVDQIVEIMSIELNILNQTPTDQNIRLMPILIHTLGIDTNPMINQEIHLAIDIEFIPTIGLEATQIVEINDIKTIDREIIQTIDHIIKDVTRTIIKIDHETTHKIGTQTLTIDKETILNHLIGTIHVIQILKTNIEAEYQNIKDK